MSGTDEQSEHGTIVAQSICSSVVCRDLESIEDCFLVSSMTTATRSFWCLTLARSPARVLCSYRILGPSTFVASQLQRHDLVLVLLVADLLPGVLGLGLLGENGLALVADLLLKLSEPLVALGWHTLSQH